MASNNVMPEGVTVEPGRVNDFINGIYGVKHKANKRALDSAVLIAGSVIAYTAYKNRRLQRRPR